MRRLRKRISVNLNARLILSKRSYKGYIENLSERGIKWYRYAIIQKEPSEFGIYSKQSSSRLVIDFSTGTTLELQVKLPSGEKLNLNCKIRWSHKPKSDDLIDNLHIDPTPKYTALGMEIINPPSAYKEFFKTLR